MAVIPTNAQPIYVGQEFFAPAFRIMARQKELKAQEHDITSVSYSDSLDKIDSFEMTVNNWDAEKLTFKYSDRNDFDPLQHVELWMGYYENGKDRLQRMVTGEITTIAPNFPASGAPTLSVGGLNLLHRLRSKQVSPLFLNKTDTEIAEALIGDIAKEVHATSPNTTLQLSEQDIKDNKLIEQPLESMFVPNTTPVDFLLKRSRMIGYEFFVEENSESTDRLVILRYRRPAKAQRPLLLLEWGKSLISFQPTLQTARQVSEVTVRGWNPKTKQEIVGKATRTTLPDAKLIQLSDLKIREDALTQRQEILVDRPIQSQAEANNLAQQTLRQIMQDLIEARGRTIGNPDLRAGTKIAIAGAGERFSGAYLITSTSHSIGEGGYTTDFVARKENP